MISKIVVDGWKSNIRFSSAHIIPDYAKCGRLHGHTYAVNAVIIGGMDENGIIMDFTSFKKHLRDVVESLDHKVLIPARSSHVKIIDKDNSIIVESHDKKYMFPAQDCVLLPIVSSTAENLAGYILGLLLEKVDFPSRIKSVEIGVDEGFGQGAFISKDL